MDSAQTAKERLLNLSSMDLKDKPEYKEDPSGTPAVSVNVAAEYTGGSVSYYAVDIRAPFNASADPYTAECQDIINALKLDFNEGSAFKAIWRRAAARLGKKKLGYDNGLYDAEKTEFYGNQMKRTTPVADQESN